MSEICFVGIGNMGWPMAARLAAAGHTLHVVDARPDVAEHFAAAHGGLAHSDAAAGAAACAILVTMLPTSAEVAATVDIALPSLRPGSLVIDMTSGTPTATQEIARRVAGQASAMIDAPVSGGVARARTGELAIMVGGTPADVARARPVLAAMGTTITRCGDIGAGQAMKALNNLVSAAGFLIGIEALLVGQRFGLDPGLMTDVLNASTGMNNSTQKKFRQFVLSRSFASGFGLDLMAKDLSIALQVGRDGGVPTPFAALCGELWAAASTRFGAGHDHTEMARFVEEMAGIELAGGG